MTDKDMVFKTEVLDIYAELYDEFNDAPDVIKVLHKLYDKINRLQPIVKCKNCKFWFDPIRCPLYSEGMLTDGNWFCANGKRR